jgi:predicted nucleotidyltransferase
MIYTIEELKRRIAPVAVKYGLPAVYVFGSYARGEATDDSDVDIVVDRTGTGLEGWAVWGDLFDDLAEAVEKPIDLIEFDVLEQDYNEEDNHWLVKNVNKEKKKIYG